MPSARLRTGPTESSSGWRRCRRSTDSDRETDEASARVRPSAGRSPNTGKKVLRSGRDARLVGLGILTAACPPPESARAARCRVRVCCWRSLLRARRTHRRSRAQYERDLRHDAQRFVFGFDIRRVACASHRHRCSETKTGCARRNRGASAGHPHAPGCDVARGKASLVRSYRDEARLRATSTVPGLRERERVGGGWVPWVGSATGQGRWRGASVRPRRGGLGCRAGAQSAAVALGTGRARADVAFG